MASSVTWTPLKLDQLGFVGRGRSRHRPRDAALLYGGPYPFFQTGDVKAADFYLTDYRQTYSEQGLAQSKLWQPGTLCITIAANIAESAILGIEGCFPDSVVGFVAHPDKSDVRFIKYYMDTLKLQMQSVSRGTTQDNLSLDKLLSFDFSVPPLLMQRRIADVLSAYDELIDNNKRRATVLETMVRTVYREWFAEYRYPDHEAIARVASSRGEIPEGWEFVPFTDFADVLSGGTPSTGVDEYWNGDIPFFTPRDAPDGFYTQATAKHLTERGLSNCASDLYTPETIFITARGTVGKVALSAVPMAMNQSCYALRGVTGIPQRFLFLLTLQQVEYLRTNTGGATFDTIVIDTFRRMHVLKPAPAIIALFARYTDALFEQLVVLQQQLRNLRRTRDLLLPRLLSGELVLSQSEPHI